MATQWILPLTKGQKKTQMTLSKKRKISFPKHTEISIYYK